MSALRVAVLGAVALVALAAPAIAATDDGKLGGPEAGADPAATACPAGKAVTGVSGSIGDIGGNPIVGSVAVACESGGTGTSMGTAPSGADPAGSSTCASGEVAVGITGYEGDFVDRLSLRCRAASLIGATTTATGYGGAGGVADGPYDCPDGERLIGLTGSVVFSGSTLRTLEISCARPPAPEPQPPGTGEPPGGGPGGGAPLTITIARAKSRRNGTVVLPVDVPGAGRVRARNIPLSAVQPSARRTLFKTASVSATAAGRVRLILKPTRAGRRLLATKRHRFRTGARVSFTAADGNAAPAKTTRVLFKKPR